MWHSHTHCYFLDVVYWGYPIGVLKCHITPPIDSPDGFIVLQSIGFHMARTNPERYYTYYIFIRMEGTGWPALIFIKIAILCSKLQQQQKLF